MCVLLRSLPINRPLRCSSTTEGRPRCIDLHRCLTLYGPPPTSSSTKLFVVPPQGNGCISRLPWILNTCNGPHFFCHQAVVRGSHRRPMEDRKLMSVFCIAGSLHCVACFDGTLRQLQLCIKLSVLCDLGVAGDSVSLSPLALL